MNFSVCCAGILCYSSLAHNVASEFGDILPATKVAAIKVAKDSWVRYILIMGRLEILTMFCDFQWPRGAGTAILYLRFGMNDDLVCRS
jgi:hypothetical protein